MATYKNGITGAFLGKVGPVVGVLFRGKEVMRSAPKKSTKPASAKQLIQQAKMSKAMQLLYPIKELLNLYFGVPIGSSSRVNLAFSYYLTEVTKIEGDTIVVDYKRMLFAQGYLQFLSNLACVNGTENTLQFTWSDNSNQGGTKPTDELIVVIFNPLKEEYVCYAPAGIRADEMATVALPDNFAGDNVYVYAFMASVDGKSNSSSWCLGSYLVG